MSTANPFPPYSHPGEESAGQNDGGHDAHSHESVQNQRHTAKGHAAYASTDKGAHAAGSNGSGFGPLGGLFADDAAAPIGHGVKANREEDMLANVPTESLQAACVVRICPECPVKKEADDLRLRSLADLDNARKRLARERDEQVRFAAENVLADIIPSLDNLDLALQHAGNNAACRDLVIGVEMTRKLLFEALQKQGLELTGIVGEPFDPSIHEAVSTAETPEVPPGHVCALVSRGYKLKDRLLRPARVVVRKAD